VLAYGLECDGRVSVILRWQQRFIRRKAMRERQFARQPEVSLSASLPPLEDTLGRRDAVARQGGRRGGCLDHAL